MDLKSLVSEVEINNKIKVIIIVSLLQLVTLVLILNKSIILLVEDYNYTYNFPKIFDYILLIAIMSIYLFIGVTIVAAVKEDIFSRKYKNNDEIIKALRIQKHDFHNHLVVIDGLLQLDKIHDARDYINSISTLHNEIFSISNIEIDSVSALFYKKIELANSKGIKTKVNVDSYLSDIKMNVLDLCTILFNLLDNAIYELENCQLADEKVLTLNIREEKSEYGVDYVIQVINSVPVLKEYLYEKIFEKGYTTKMDDKTEHGFGLHNVKKLVEKNKGEIAVESFRELGTVFTIYIPKYSDIR